jgi:hypothetical protein
VGAGAAVGRVLHVPENEQLDRSALACWAVAPVALEPQPDAGPIVV